MIDGIGMDIVDIARFRGVMERRGEAFLRRVFTGGELEYCMKKARPEAHLAARFAAKEAFYKAAGRTGVPFRFRDVDVRRDNDGRPFIVSPLVGEGRRAHLSLSHDGNMATAQVVMERTA